MNGFTGIIQHIHHILIIHPGYAGLIAFSIALLESIAVIGTIIPSSVTMTFVGSLVGSGWAEFYPIWLWSTIGALIGDSLSFCLGGYLHDHRFGHYLKKRFKRGLNIAERLIEKHGVASVIIGRFIGPLRSFVPLFVGMLNMRFRDFILADIIACSAWSFAYIIPGILLGAISSQLPPKIAMTMLGWGLAIILIIALGLYLLTISWQYGEKRFHKFVIPLWRQYFYRSRTPFASLTNNMNNNSRYPTHQVGLIMLCIIIVTTFILFMLSNHGIMADTNIKIFNFFQYIQQPSIISWSVILSMFANKYVLTATTCLFASWIYLNGYHSAARWIVGVTLTSIIIIIALKLLIAEGRPPLPNLPIRNDSFPSGHVTLLTVVIGGISYLLSTNVSPDQRGIYYHFLALSVPLVALSRIFIGAHWLNDTIGGFILGLGILMISIALWRTQKRKAIKIPGIINTTICIWVLCWAGYGIMAAKKKQEFYLQNHYQKVIMSPMAWWVMYDPKLQPKITPCITAEFYWMLPAKTIVHKLRNNGWQQSISNGTPKCQELSKSNKIEKIENFGDLIKVLAKYKHQIIFSTEDHNYKVYLKIRKMNFKFTAPNNIQAWHGRVFVYSKKQNKIIPQNDPIAQNLTSQLIDDISKGIHGQRHYQHIYQFDSIEKLVSE